MMAARPSALTVTLPGDIPVLLGEQSYTARALPFGKLRQLSAVLQRLGNGLGASAGGGDYLDDMAAVITLGLGLAEGELDAIPAVSIDQIGAAFTAVMRVSGMEAEIERNLGEALRRAQSLALTPGTPSTPVSAPSPAGSGA